jgi:hypothetical protein
VTTTTQQQAPATSGPGPSGPLAHALALAPALVAGAVVHWPALRMFFAQDDVTFLLRAAGLEPTPWSLARPLSEGLAWQLQYAAFGMNPAPYAATRLALHLACAALVYAAGLRLLRGRGAAAAAALLFAASSVAFTPVHWGACIVELLAALFALAAFVVFLAARARDSGPLAWLAGGIVAAAVLAKESTVTLPAAFALVPAYGRPARRALRTLLPAAAAVALLAAAFLLTRSRFSYGQYTGGDAYAMDFAPSHLFANLSTYLQWLVTIGLPVRDRAAFADAGAWRAGGAVLVAVAVALWACRRDERRAALLGAGWFAAFLLPVLPLVNHTYYYYLYLPWAGACWLGAAAFEHFAARGARALVTVLACALLATFVFAEWNNVRAREAAMMGPVPADKTVREGRLLGNLVKALRAAQLSRGDEVGFLSPWQSEHFQADGRARTEEDYRAYLPVEGVLRNGESLRLFLPGVSSLGFTDVPPPEWDGARLFLFDNDGTLTPLGQGPRALIAYSAWLRRADRNAEADTLMARGLQGLMGSKR